MIFKNGSMVKTMTKQEFGSIVSVIRGVYRDKTFLTDKEVKELWFELLKDIPYEQAKSAVMKHAMTSKWTPTIAEIREQVVEIQADATDWGDGWKEVLMAIRKHGYRNENEALSSMSPMTREVVKRLGWDQICNSEQDDLTAIRANFRMMFEQKRNTAKEEMQLPVGFKEKAKSITERSVELLE